MIPRTLALLLPLLGSPALAQAPGGSAGPAPADAPPAATAPSDASPTATPPPAATEPPAPADPQAAAPSPALVAPAPATNPALTDPASVPHPPGTAPAPARIPADPAAAPPDPARLNAAPAAPPPPPALPWPAPVDLRPNGALRLRMATDAPDAATRRVLEDIGRRLALSPAGRVTVEVQVSLHPRDASLARRAALARARAVKDALVAGGLPETRIDLRPLGRLDPPADLVDILPPGAGRTPAPR